MAAKKTAKKSAKRPAKKAAPKSGKRPIKKAAAKRPSAAKKSAKKSAKRPAKKAPAKKSAAKAAVSAAAKIEIPPVPTRVSTTPAPKQSSGAPKPVAPQKKSSPTALFLVIAGVVVLAIVALANRSSTDDGSMAKPTTSPTSETSASASASPTASALANHEAPVGFVAIAHGDMGVTLHWKAPAATEGITGYTISVSYDAKNFTEVATVPGTQFSLDVSKASDEGGTQFLIQTVYSDGTKVDGKKFSLKGNYK
mgnify:CR=1 FL=1